MRIVLASASPRRSELLRQVGVDFKVKLKETNEDCNLIKPYDYVKDLSLRKAMAVFKSLDESEAKDTVVIGADTVVYHDGKILLKPKDREDAFNIIKELSGNTHQVYTGVALVTYKRVVNFSEKTDVYVYTLSDDIINDYVNTKEPYDKAGAYGIQGLFGAYIKGIDGDYNNVVGLPVSRVVYELNKLGYRIDYERY